VQYSIRRFSTEEKVIDLINTNKLSEKYVIHMMVERQFGVAKYSQIFNL
jgi:hypothetical protein